MNKLILASLAAVCVAGASTVFAQPASKPMQASADAPRATLTSLPMTGAATDQSYVACFFKTPVKGDVSWQWALTKTNAYFTFPGQWRKTDYTKNQKFFSSTQYADIQAACLNAKEYYKEVGDVMATFAATSNTGYNYPMVLNGVEISPTY